MLFELLLGKFTKPEKDVKKVQQANKFLERHNEYYMGKLSDEDITGQSTQPFWQSMRLSKERLMENDLTMEVEYKKGFGLSSSQKCRDKQNEVLELEENVLTKRIFYKNGRKIYAKNTRDVCQTDLLKSAIDGDEALCPNCGHKGKLSSYFDGCDYCNAKFSVKELEQKVSGFSFREDVVGKLQDFAVWTDKISQAFTYVIPFAILFAFFISIEADVGYVSLGTEYFADFILGIALHVGILYTFAIGIVAIVNKIFIKSLDKNHSGRVTISELAGKKIDNFSQQDYVQNLEWKLKSIFLTKDASKIKAFTKCDISALLECREDVVDSSLTSLHIEKCKENSSGYEITARVVMRNYKYINGCIKEAIDEFLIKTTCRRDVYEQPIWSLRQYICSGCGSSIDVLNGAVCDYCQTEMDYSDVGFVITDIRYLGPKKSEYPKLALKISKNYLIAIAISVVIGIIGIPGVGKFIVAHMNVSQIEQCYELYDKKPSLQEVADVKVTLIEESEVGYSRRSVYRINEGLAQDIISDYFKMLRGLGYEYDNWYRYKDSNYSVEDAATTAKYVYKESMLGDKKVTIFCKCYLHDGCIIVDEYVK